ncbi:MAG: hypothetical protein QXU98_02135 [Candidatus Parvarchaeota archaeon]
MLDDELYKLVNSKSITEADKYILLKKITDPSYRLKQVYEEFSWDSLRGRYEILMLPDSLENIDKSEYNLNKILDMSLLGSEEISNLDEAYKLEGELYIPGVDKSAAKAPARIDFDLRTKDSVIGLKEYKLDRSIVAKSFHWDRDPVSSQMATSIELSGEERIIVTLRRTYSGNELRDRRLYRYDPGREEKEQLDIEGNSGLLTLLSVLERYHDMRLVEGRPKVDEYQKQLRLSKSRKTEPFDGMYV